MKRAVFDTNIVVSGFLSPYGPPGRIVDWLRQGDLVAVLDDRIFREYAEVLTRPIFGLPANDITTTLAGIAERAEWVDIPPQDAYQLLPDPDDAPFVECASIARVPLVTGNLRHFPRRLIGRLVVLTPVEFIKQMHNI
ncbi:MAG: putative toxin-antitoxin system toxin component, PIN family [Deltaproteobacteria bacterium]|nr:putative toxin-antitoxin system toxin component, PIN family [Deltaproteobacteria bacterium]